MRTTLKQNKLYILLEAFAELSAARSSNLFKHNFERNITQSQTPHPTINKNANISAQTCAEITNRRTLDKLVITKKTAQS